MRKLIPILACLCLPLAAPVAFADNYNVEIIVFEHLGADTSGGEMFNRARELPPARLVETDPKFHGAGQLATTAKLLESDPAYRILTHVSWVQAATPKANAKAIPLRVGDGATEKLNGYVRFYRASFLHMDVDLAFHPDGGDRARANVYVIQEKHRVKPRETVYFDHPRFGVLARIAPIGR